MELLQGDDDDRVFEATMAFIDEFSFDEPEPANVTALEAPMQQIQTHTDLVTLTPDSGANPTPTAIDVVKLLRGNGSHATKSTTPSKVPSILSLDATGMTRREKIVARNARKKLLRKAGIYGDSNRVRNERKLEIAYLRDRIEKLQIDLKTLQTHKDGQPDARKSTQQHEANHPRTNTLVVTMDSTSPISSVWHEIADRQQRRRKEAERENIRLKLVMERQRKVANTLCSLLQKRASQLESDCSCFSSLNCPKHQIVHVLDYHGDISSVRGLFRHLDAAYLDIDAVFAANGLSSMAITPSDVHIRQGVGGKYLEVFSNKVLPFKLQDATEAAWDHFKGTDKHMGNGSLYTKAKKDLDEPYTIIEVFTKEVYSNSSRADVKMKQVVRRFVEPDRDIVIWVASVAPTEIRHKMLKGLTYHLRGYALTKRSTASTPVQELSQLQFCYLISLDQDIDGRYDDSDNMRALTNFLIVNTAQNMRVHQSGVENRLIDQALRSQRDYMAFFLEDEDDGRVLEAALSFVDKFDSLSSRTEAAPPQPQMQQINADAGELTRRAVVNAKKRILRKAGVYSDPNRARNERRREVAYLREELEKLQIDLRNLQASSSKKPRQQPLLVVNSMPQVAVPSLWQVVARKQKQRREEAERENARLKVIAARQQKVADSLSCTLQKRARQLISECSSFADVRPKQQIVPVMDFCGDIDDFQGLFRQVEAARLEVDIVFAANGLDKMVITPSDVHIREGDEGKYLEAFSNKVLPFKLSDTSEAAWNHFKGVEKHLGNGSIYEKAAKDLGEAYTVIEAFTKEMHSNNSRADVKVKQVVRRYVEADHDLVIWVARVSPAEIRHKILRGLTYHLRGYAKIMRSARELSQLQCCSLITFDQEAEALYGLDTIRTLTNFLIVNSAMKTQGHQDRIESALVDQALRREMVF
ncbi:hypothetical protein PF001_g15417 [Phytophthora fragariae]|uniref:M96 mating-specific protein family n=3 Tax=Phytophthora fragariae TaxID=53985 RepID=A0A6A3EKA8_9STRA|nr:hypothetical protein PF003_g32645 [Phytophthora fragariae]KAE8932933.1 hypothetical protein PF009_g17059 [Phytophthora fragariae]KAE9133256.1 hypothetical protein PF006_g15079 [Phytophthora fragariae]KAE9299512.1 hypothetical protein PF001_g15417 [Phytophthora fragariae]